MCEYPDNSSVYVHGRSQRGLNFCRYGVEQFAGIIFEKLSINTHIFSRFGALSFIQLFVSPAISKFKCKFSDIAQ